MAWVIDEFGVKPTGFLASWRYTRVLVDDNGIITNEDVPFKKPIEGGRVSDYAKNNRTHNNGDIITTFCNVVTHTRYTIIADDVRPFAITQDELNVPECGYLTPLPTPNVPYNPFGTAVYGDYRQYSFCDIEGVPVVVTIAKKAYTGEVTQIEHGGKSPFVLSYKEVDLDKDVFMPSEAIMTFIVEDNFLLQEFYTDDERMFMVTATKNGVTIFKGFINPDSCSEPFIAPPYPVTIKANDGFGALKSITYPFPITATFDLTQSFTSALCYALAPLNLNLNISIICNLYEDRMKTGLNDNPLDQAFINPLRFANDKGETWTCYDVIENICATFKMTCVQSGGTVYFYRRQELVSGNARQRNYDYTGRFINAEFVNNYRVMGRFL